MTRYEISNRQSGVVLGVYKADDFRAALDLMAVDAGYASYAAMCETLEWSEDDARRELSVVALDLSHEYQD